MARPKPSDSSVDVDVFVFDTSVLAFMPKEEIMCVSSVPSIQLSPPGVPWLSVSKLFET